MSGSAPQYSATDGEEKQSDEAVSESSDDIPKTGNVVVCGWVEISHAPDAPQEDGEERNAKRPTALAESEKPRMDKDKQCDDALSHVVGDGKEHGGNDA